MNPSVSQKWDKLSRGQSIGDWLILAREEMRSLPDEPLSSLFALCAHTLARPNYWMQAHPEYTPTADELSELNCKLQRLFDNEPLAYILGRQSFFGMEFQVNQHVLIPRPETELLVQQALNWLGNQKKGCTIVDVGTGSGCIALSIAHHSTQTRVIAIDISINCLMLARQNCLNHRLERRVSFMQSDLLSSLTGPFDLICANLPYIPSLDLKELRVSRFEPTLALDGGPDGLNLIRDLMLQARPRLHADGLLLLEIESGQADGLRLLAQTHFPGASVTILPDLNGLPRLARIEMQ